MNTPKITAEFAPDLDTCTIVISGHVYHNLRVKKTNLRDWNDPQMVYQVFIPCRKTLGRDYMLCAGMDAIFGRQHPERKPLVLRVMDEDEIADLPKRGKKKSGQLALWKEDAL